MNRLEGKRVIFTGAVENIGKAAVKLFLSEGARVVVGDRNEKAGAALVAELGDGVSFLPVDLSKEASIYAFVKKAVDLLGGLDVVCQNAGLQRAGPTEDFDVADWDAVYTVNIRAQFLVAKHAIPYLKEGGKGGSIVNMSSCAGKKGGAGLAAYCSSKGAVVMFTNALAQELAADNVRVNAICPGWVDTAFNAAAIDHMGGLDAQAQSIAKDVPMGRQSTPDEIAPLYLYLASDESSYMTGQSILIDGGVHN